jgi:hypothetical protein
LERARIEGASAGKTQAESDHPTYDNNVADAYGVRDLLIAWIETVLEPTSNDDARDHEFVEAFDRSYRDTYHETFNRLDT